MTNAALKARRSSSWTAGQGRKKDRAAAQLAAHKLNQKNAEDKTLSADERLTPWQRACKVRAESPKRVKARTHWLRANQLSETA
jgi:hypothetical protein